MYKAILITVVSLTLATFSLSNPMKPDNVTYVSPTKITTTKVKAVPKVIKPVLTNVLIIGDYKIASFNNGRELLLGEHINGFVITQIEADHVVLNRKGKNTQINLINAGELAITPVIEE